MKKLVLASLICAMGAMSTANASWLSDMFKKDAEPQTLSEACNSDDITAICPEIALGNQTLAGCLSENVKSLSRKCAKFVKKSIKENKDLVLEEKDSATNAVNEKVVDVKAAIAERKAQKEEAKKAFKNKKAEMKATAKAAGQEFKDAAQAVKENAVETGNSVKSIVTE